LGRRHKTVPDWTKQLVKVVRRWLPDRPIKLIGDGAYSVVELGTVCRSQQITLIAPLRFDACLYTPPPARQPRQMGRPRLVGQRLPQLDQVLCDPHTAWHKAWVKWYGQGKQQIEWCSGTALWYRGGQAPLPIRWVLTRDLKGERDARAYFSTDQDQSGLSMIIDFMKRWCVEVTFEESRAHLGIETRATMVRYGDRADDTMSFWTLQCGRVAWAQPSSNRGHSIPTNCLVSKAASHLY